MLTEFCVMVATGRQIAALMQNSRAGAAACAESDQYLTHVKFGAMGNIGGKIIAITGAARGIGYATAKALLARGARVVIGDRDIAL